MSEARTASSAGTVEAPAAVRGATPVYRCRRATFTQAEFDTHAKWFWAVPPEWGRGNGQAFLSQLWEEGRSGLISVLPVLGQYAHHAFAHEVHLSQEKLARLAGVDRKTVGEVAPLLREFGLAHASLTLHRGEWVTEWDVHSKIAAVRADRLSSDAYFWMSSRLIYGGNWARLSPVQRAIYLAAACHASTSDREVPNHPILAHHLADTATLDDLIACQEQHPKRWVRLARLSYAELSRITGICQSAVKKAVGQLKRPDVWEFIDMDWEDEHDVRMTFLAHSPITVYPSDQGSLIYAFRDHAPPWPWEVLNRRKPPARTVTMSLDAATEANLDMDADLELV